MNVQAPTELSWQALVVKSCTEVSCNLGGLFTSTSKGMVSLVGPPPTSSQILCLDLQSARNNGPRSQNEQYSIGSIGSILLGILQVQVNMIGPWYGLWLLLVGGGLT